MHSDCGFDDSCMDNGLQPGGCSLNSLSQSLNNFNGIRQSCFYHKGTLVFIEGHPSRGVYILCSGRMKLSVSSAAGKRLILHIATSDEILGLSATISDSPYEMTAEAIEECQAVFVRKQDFVNFLRENNDACLKVAQHLSRYCHKSYTQLRALNLSQSVGERVSRLLLEWCAADGRQTEHGIQLMNSLSHEEMAEMVGTSRETVTRILSDLKRKRIINVNGSKIVVCNQVGLEAFTRATRCKNSKATTTTSG